MCFIPQQNQKIKAVGYIGPDSDAPEHLKASFITHGYRINYKCPKQLFKTAFTFHNQTINIWTHFLPSLFILLTLFVISYAQASKLQHLIPSISKINDRKNNYQNPLGNQKTQQFKQFVNKDQIIQCSKNLTGITINSWVKFENSKSNCDKNLKHKQLQRQKIAQSNDIQLAVWPIYQFLVCATFCLLCSSIFHLFNPLSLSHFIKLHRCDLSGIFLLIASSSIAVLYYGLYQNSNFVVLYSVVNCIFGVTLFFVSLGDWFYRSCNSKYRIICCLGYAMLCGIPFLHIMTLGVIFNRPKGDYFDSRAISSDMLSVIGSYGVGVIFYVKKFPQRLFPGKFNILGHSHQIWHIFVVMGIVSTFKLMMSQYQIRIMAIQKQNM